MWIDALISLKKKSGKTLKQIADESGVPLGTLNKLFAGQTKDPKLETIRSVVYALGFTLDDLEEKENAPTPSKDDVGALTKEELSRISAAMAQLNEEGRERVVEYAEDLAAGGRFKKPCSTDLGKKEA